MEICEMQLYVCTNEVCMKWSYMWITFVSSKQVVLVIYIVIFLVLVITSYRKSAALRNSLNRHLRLQSSNYGATMIVDCDNKGRVRCETIEDNIQEATQLWGRAITGVLCAHRTALRVYIGFQYNRISKKSIVSKLAMKLCFS